MDLKLKNDRISVVLEVLVFISIISLVTSENPQGFISIDCGRLNGKDPTGLEWVPDDAYLKDWNELSGSDIAVKAGVDLPQKDFNPDRWNERQLSTAMVFKPGAPDRNRRMPRSKFCYDLTLVDFDSLTPGNYLLRATFPTSKSISPKASWDAYSARFYFTVDSTYIATIEVQEERAQIIELIVTPLDEQIFVCLVPLEDRSSMPAISALELRPFSKNMYTRNTEDNTAGMTRSQTSYLITLNRWNLGGNSIRYPGDLFDRLWSSPPVPFEQSGHVVSRNITVVNPDSDTAFSLPLDTIRSAWVGTSSSSEIKLTFNLSWSRLQQPTPSYYYVFGFGNQGVNMSYEYFDGKTVQLFTSSNPLLYPTGSTAVGFNKRRSFVNDLIPFTFTSNNLQSPLISSAEMYGEFNAIMRRSSRDDSFFITSFADRSGAAGALQLDRSGDPCLPVPWAWVICSVELPPRVTQINLTGKGFNGSLPESFGTLDRLTILDLSHNFFSGHLPESLGDISTLGALNLQNNSISGSIPSYASWKNMKTLSLANNHMTGDLSSLFLAVDASLTYLDVSNNSFSGTLSVSVLAKLVNLEYLDLSNNQLSGDLQLDMLSDDSLKNLKSLNLEGNQFKTFNLNTWYESVKKARNFYTCEVCAKLRLGKAIEQLYLPPESFDQDLIVDKPTSYPRFVNTSAFVLVDPDSPWCKEYKNRRKFLLVRYLCRKNEHDDFWAEPKDKNVQIMIITVSVVCGVLLLFTTSLFAYLLSRTKKQAIEIQKEALELQKENEKHSREIEELRKELASEDLSPPFFDYVNLIRATSNFSEGNLLGRGGFGTVYKAVYPDRDLPLAVKVLRPDENKKTESLKAEFLKEIKSIIGVQHKNLIHLKGYSVGKNSQCILVYEYAENRSLAEALWDEQKDFSLTWKQRFNICLGIARGLAYLHQDLQPARYHRDIKPQNILLDSEYNAKIADFGLTHLARTETPQTKASEVQGTCGYSSTTSDHAGKDSESPYQTLEPDLKFLHVVTWLPESFDGTLSEKHDVYSFGVVLLEIVSGMKCVSKNLPTDHGQKLLRTWAFQLFQENGLLGLLDKELLQRGDYNKEEVLLVLHIALASCQDNPEERPTMIQIVHMLMKHESAAINIIPAHRPEPLKMEDIIGLTTLSTIEEDESEDSALLASTTVYLLKQHR